MKTLKHLTARLANVEGPICVTISMPTHRTFPANRQDAVLLKNLLRDAQNRLIDRFGKRESTGLLERLSGISENTNHDHNLDSLHIFLSEDLDEVVHLPLKMQEGIVHVDHHFHIEPLRRAMDEQKEYLLLLLSQGGVHLFDGLNDGLVSEIRNTDFPFHQNRHYITHADKASDAKKLDKGVREYFNKVDKAVQTVHRESALPVIVVSTARNYQHLRTVADKPAIYAAHDNINYNDVSWHTLGKQAWEILNSSD